MRNTAPSSTTTTMKSLASTNAAEKEALQRLDEKCFLAHTHSYSAFTIVRKYNAGNYATVFEATLDHKKVALKQFNRRSELLQETYALLQLDSPHIITPLAICMDPPCLAVEFHSNGDCFDYFGRSIHWEYRIGIAYDTCKAIEYLHTRGWVHRDIKKENVVLTDNLRGVLIDFNFAGPIASSSKRKLGTLEYMAPELFLTPFPSDLMPADIYSLGILFFNILISPLNAANVLKEVLNASYDSPEQESKAIYKKIKETLLITTFKRDSCYPLLNVLILRCTHPKPESRPVINDVVESFKTFIESKTKSTLPSPLHSYLAPMRPQRKIIDFKETDASYQWIEKGLIEEFYRLSELKKLIELLITEEMDSKKLLNDLISLFIIAPRALQNHFIKVLIISLNEESKIKLFVLEMIFYLYHITQDEAQRQALEGHIQPSLFPSAKPKEKETFKRIANLDNVNLRKQAGLLLFQRNFSDSVDHYHSARAQEVRKFISENACEWTIAEYAMGPLDDNAIDMPKQLLTL